MPRASTKRGLHVTVIERLDAPMGAVLDADMGADMAADMAGAMRAAGIDLRLGTAVTGFTVLGGRVTAVETAAGSFAADIVVIGPDLRPNAELAMEIARTGLSERDGTVIEFDGRRVLSDCPIEPLHFGHLSEVPSGGWLRSVAHRRHRRV